LGPFALVLGQILNGANRCRSDVNNLTNGKFIAYRGTKKTISEIDEYKVGQ